MGILHAIDISYNYDLKLNIRKSNKYANMLLCYNILNMIVANQIRINVWVALSSSQWTSL